MGYGLQWLVNEQGERRPIRFVQLSSYSCLWTTLIIVVGEERDEVQLRLLSLVFRYCNHCSRKGGWEGGWRRAGSDAATEEDSADAHYSVVQTEDKSWPRRWTTPSFNQTWRRLTTPGQCDATINLLGTWANRGQPTYCTLQNNL